MPVPFNCAGVACLNKNHLRTGPCRWCWWPQVRSVVIILWCTLNLQQSPTYFVNVQPFVCAYAGVKIHKCCVVCIQKPLLHDHRKTVNHIRSCAFTAIMLIACLYVYANSLLTSEPIDYYIWTSVVINDPRSLHYKPIFIDTYEIGVGCDVLLPPHRFQSS